MTCALSPARIMTVVSLIFFSQAQWVHAEQVSFGGETYTGTGQHLSKKDESSCFWSGFTGSIIAGVASRAIAGLFTTKPIVKNMVGAAGFLVPYASIENSCLELGWFGKNTRNEIYLTSKGEKVVIARDVAGLSRHSIYRYRGNDYVLGPDAYYRVISAPAGK